jgi:hypothetical protein
MSDPLFSSAEIESCAHPSVVEAGRRLLNSGCALNKIEHSRALSSALP